MSDFTAALAKFNVTAQRRVLDAFVFSTEEVRTSIRDGSALTGAPGQPVQVGNLKASWQGEFLSPTLWQFTATGIAPGGEKVGYAEYIEEGINRHTGGPLILRSQVGGFHSVKMTRAGWARIVKFAAGKAAHGG